MDLEERFRDLIQHTVISLVIPMVRVSALLTKSRGTTTTDQQSKSMNEDFIQSFDSPQNGKRQQQQQTTSTTRTRLFHRRRRRRRLDRHRTIIPASRLLR